MNNQALLSKALGAVSDDEAIACLKMARKKGVKIEDIATSTSDPGLTHVIEGLHATIGRYKTALSRANDKNAMLSTKVDGLSFHYFFIVVVTSFVWLFLWLGSLSYGTSCFLF